MSTDVPLLVTFRSSSFRRMFLETRFVHGLRWDAGDTRLVGSKRKLLKAVTSCEECVHVSSCHERWIHRLWRGRLKQEERRSA